MLATGESSCSGHDIMLIAWLEQVQLLRVIHLLITVLQ